METITPEQRDNLIATFKRTAVHLETRDVYATNIEKDRFRKWFAGEPLNPEDEAEWWRPWLTMMRRNMDAGKTMRRLRIVSEPVTDYIKFEWLDTEQIVSAGEEVRWLPRRVASTLLLPGNDFWLFDDETVAFTHFSGNGNVVGYEMTTNLTWSGSARLLSRPRGQWPLRTASTHLPDLPTPVHQAREALGARLREIRKDANLTGRALAVLTGWHFTKVSKLENGARSPSEEDIRIWCNTCNAPDQISDLIATVRNIEAMYLEYRRQMQAGQKHFQDSFVPLYERTRLFRVYETTVIPGLFTTAEYAATIFRFWAEFMDLSDDVDAAVAARMERQRVLYTGKRRFLFVIEEQVLRTRVGDSDIMAGQLDRLLAVMSLPRVSVGIVPSMGERHSLAQGSFWIFDDSRVHVETVSAGLDISQPREIALYVRVFERLQRSAVYGHNARHLIALAMSDIAGEADLSSPTSVNTLAATASASLASPYGESNHACTVRSRGRASRPGLQRMDRRQGPLPGRPQGG